MKTETPASSFSVKTLATIVLVVALLYWAKEVFIPFALAVLLSFLLGPLVTRLRRWGFGRITAVSTVTLLAFAFLFSLGWVVTHELRHFARELPNYRRNIQAKVQSVHGPLTGQLDKTSRAIQELQAQFVVPDRRNHLGRAERVEIVQPAPTLPQLLHRALGPLFRPLGTALMVTVLVVCMLLNREDLRNRLIRLFGRHRLPAATQALDDAARGVSRFLLMQSIINGGYGLSFGLGLYLIGLPNSVLWGVGAAVLRFIPYIGSWIAALMPIFFSLAVFSGWTQTLLVLGLFILLEIVSNYLIEPWLYGTRTGLSPLAVLLAAIFWAWLWGPAGLLLSTPLTVCVVVISKHVPQLAFFSILLGDEAVLGPKSRLYQRLLALDKEEADELVSQQLEEKPLIEVCDTIFVPILRLASTDRRRGALEGKRAAFLFSSLREQISALADRSNTASVVAGEVRSGSVFVLCVPAQDEADELAALLFVKLLQRKGISARQTTVSALTDEMDRGEVTDHTILCVSAISPSSPENA
ncbi:MAG: AI-2E family transporter, partial [Acidobacteria bacterium]|nr:AI-2E family transporter [Acidobacteriota bacterium]